MQGLHLNLNQIFIWASEEICWENQIRRSKCVSKMVYSIMLSVCQFHILNYNIWKIKVERIVKVPYNK